MFQICICTLAVSFYTLIRLCLIILCISALINQFRYWEGQNAVQIVTKPRNIGL